MKTITIPAKELQKGDVVHGYPSAINRVFRYKKLLGEGYGFVMEFESGTQVFPNNEDDLITIDREEE